MINNQPLEKYASKAFISYSREVILDRAIPRLTDSLKPVHRRLLWALYTINKDPKKTIKCAKVIGETIARYHPHGDIGSYLALVGMIQPWNGNIQFIRGQGNFGSIDGDPAGAYRYTECTLTEEAFDLVFDEIGFDTVNFVPNFDETSEEPEELPTKIPFLLINGTYGIAVGMTTNIPPHNFHEVINTTLTYLKDKKVKEIFPDYPTGGSISILDIKTYLNKATISYDKIQGTSRYKIIITEIPFGTNKPGLVKQIAILMFDKKLEIDDVNDASDKNGICIEIKTKPNADPNEIINILYAKTECTLKQNYIWNLVHKDKVKEYNTESFIKEWVEWRINVIIRKCNYYIKELEKESHILQGLIIFYNNRKEILEIISQKLKMEEVKNKLTTQFSFSEAQLDYILKMSISRINGLEEDKIKQDLDIALKSLREWIGYKTEPINYIIRDIETIKEKYKDKFHRKTKIEN